MGIPTLKLLVHNYRSEISQLLGQISVLNTICQSVTKSTQICDIWSMEILFWSFRSLHKMKMALWRILPSAQLIIIF